MQNIKIDPNYGSNNPGNVITLVDINTDASDGTNGTTWKIDADQPNQLGDSYVKYIMTPSDSPSDALPYRTEIVIAILGCKVNSVNTGIQHFKNIELALDEVHTFSFFNSTQVPDCGYKQSYTVTLLEREAGKPKPEYFPILDGQNTNPHFVHLDAITGKLEIRPIHPKLYGKTYAVFITAHIETDSEVQEVPFVSTVIDSDYFEVHIRDTRVDTNCYLKFEDLLPFKEQTDEPISVSTYVGSSFNKTSYEDVQAIAAEALKIDDQNFTYCGEMTVILVTEQKILQLDTEQQIINIVSSEKDAVGVYGPAKLEFKRDKQTISVPIVATIKECQVENLTWQSASISIAYEIGSGKSEKTVPDTV